MINTFLKNNFFAFFIFILLVPFIVSADVPKAGWKKDSNGNILIYRSHSYLHFIGPAFLGGLGIILMFENIPNHNLRKQIVNRLSGAGLASFSGYWFKLLYKRYCDIEKPVLVLTKNNITYEGQGFLKYGIPHIAGSMHECGSGTYTWKSVKKVIHFQRQVNSDVGIIGDDNYLEIITTDGAFRIFENDIQISLYELIELINEFYKIEFGSK